MQIHVCSWRSIHDCTEDQPCFADIQMYMPCFVQICPQVAVQAYGVRFFICIRINLDAKTGIVYTDLVRQSLKLADCSDICSSGTVGNVGNAAQGIAFTD